MHPTQNEHSEDRQSKPVLSNEIKAFIVRGLARYDTPSQVAYAVKETFGIEVSRQRVYRYDPACSQPPAQRWRDLHAATRRAFLSEVSNIGVAQRVVRLRMLDRFAREAEDMNKEHLCAKFLEQAAKECGGVYENRRAPLSRGAVLTKDDAPQPAPRHGEAAPQGHGA